MHARIDRILELLGRWEDSNMHMADLRGISLKFQDDGERLQRFDHSRVTRRPGPGPGPVICDDSSDDDEIMGTCVVKYGAEDTDALGITLEMVCIRDVDPAGLAQQRCAQPLQPGMVLHSINDIPAEKLSYNA